MANRLDMHMHSCVSVDGEFLPAELMQLCKNNGLRTVSLTDHNSLGGLSAAWEAAERIGLEFISGIELDCQFQGVTLHLLGYGIKPTPELEDNERKLLKKERAASSQLVQMVQDLGIFFDTEQVMALSRQGIVSGEMVAEVALADARNLHSPLLERYRRGGSRSDNPYVNFYWDFCAQGKPAYVPVEFISLVEAVQLIKKAGGLAVLAHPGINIGRDQDILRGIIGCGINGIEAYSSYHDLETVAFYRRMAEEFNLLKTMGSDFHGKTKPAVKMGTMLCPEEDAIYTSIRIALDSRGSQEGKLLLSNQKWRRESALCRENDTGLVF